MTEDQAPRFIKDPQGFTEREKTAGKKDPDKTADEPRGADETGSAGDGDSVSLKVNPRIWPTTEVEIDGTRFSADPTEVNEGDAERFTSHKSLSGYQLVVRA